MSSTRGRSRSPQVWRTRRRLPPLRNPLQNKPISYAYNTSRLQASWDSSQEAPRDDDDEDPLLHCRCEPDPDVYCPLHTPSSWYDPDVQASSAAGKDPLLHCRCEPGSDEHCPLHPFSSWDSPEVSITICSEDGSGAFLPFASQTLSLGEKPSRRVNSPVVGCKA